MPPTALFRAAESISVPLGGTEIAEFAETLLGPIAVNHAATRMPIIIPHQ